LDEEGKVEFIILYGSLREGRFSELSDIDLAVGYSGDRRRRFDFRIKALGELGDKFDIQIYEDLPLYIQEEVLRGEVLYVKNADFLNEVALKTIRDLIFYKPRFLDYISR
jgi:hypothetical protein